MIVTVENIDVMSVNGMIDIHQNYHVVFVVIFVYSNVNL